MRYWLRGKRGGLVGFLVIAGLVLGGLGWVTAAVLRLEREQRRARAEAELGEKVRLALWQLDSFILPDLSREEARPYYQFGARPRGAAGRDSPPPADQPDWVLLHFEADARGWRSPELTRPAGQEPSPGQARRRGQTLDELQKHWGAPSLLALVGEREAKPLVVGNTVEPADNNAALALNRNGDPQAMNNDYARRQTYQSRVRQEAAQQTPLPERVQVRQSRQLVPVWLAAPGQPERLALLRQVQIGRRQLVQGVVLDWPRLQRALADQVADLFPGARFLPVRDKAPPRPERTLTALPIELDPGPQAAGPAPSGLRLGLGIAWSAVAVALLAAGLGGWSLLDLSERRSRFVSAVTHELRTPLTTLRLYLDMLTSGMVQGEEQKAEYLHTLHAEADRLNRLVGNVLDFARLERQRPRLEKGPVAVAGLLDQVRDTWRARCQDAGKELVVENAAGGDATLTTDGRLVQQVLGNLIDNACKYSRDAADRRLWLRARGEGRRLVFEVEDRGPGVAPGERRAVFSPFRRGRGADVTAGGVGLGLALARRWAELLGGKLALQPNPDQPGARFRLELPA